MTILIADNTRLLDGSLVTACISADQRYEAICCTRGFWGIYDHEQSGRLVATYPDAPGMNALVALRRYLAERERDHRGRCDSCGQLMYADDDIVTEWLPAAGEPAAVTWTAHRRCAEGED